MSDAEWRAARLAELWADYVDNPSVSSEGDRAKAAIDVLRMLRTVHSHALEVGDDDTAFSAAGRARAVFALLTVELCDWMVEFPGVPSMATRDAWVGIERAALLSHLMVTKDALSPLHRKAADPVSVLLPRWLCGDLFHALSALNQGEVQSLVMPSVHGRHDDAWTWDQLRGRAVEYVHYYRGQGVKTGEARERVARAAHIGSFTLRQWEKDGLGRRDIAFEAGKLAVILSDQPNFAEGDGQSIDADAFALHEELIRIPLRTFGAQYIERFGHRHNQ